MDSHNLFDMDRKDGATRRNYNDLPGFLPHAQPSHSFGTQTLPPLNNQRAAPPRAPGIGIFNPSNTSNAATQFLQPQIPTAASYANFPAQRLSFPHYQQVPQPFAHNSTLGASPQMYGLQQSPSLQSASPNATQWQSGSNGHLHSSTSFAHPQPPAMAPSNAEPEGAYRTHVVGSQGRRGILPSAAGRPPAVASNASAVVLAEKDENGKYPCEFCNKTYLHAKHLKRHHLRHTGDRPYSCYLCGDTFSRSDILKRHFQKCSVRRGNPTGATHLSHAQDHLARNGSNRDSINTMSTASSIPTSGRQSTVASLSASGHTSMDSTRLTGLGLSGTPGPPTHSTLAFDAKDVKRFSDGHVPHAKRMMSDPESHGLARASFPFANAGVVTVPLPAEPRSLHSSAGSTPLDTHGNTPSGHFSQTLTPEQLDESALHAYADLDQQQQQQQQQHHHQQQQQQQHQQQQHHHHSLGFDAHPGPMASDPDLTHYSWGGTGFASDASAFASPVSMPEYGNGGGGGGAGNNSNNGHAKSMLSSMAAHNSSAPSLHDVSQGGVGPFFAPLPHDASQQAQAYWGTRDMEPDPRIMDGMHISNR